MRGTLLAILVAGGIGLAGTAAVSAAPVINGSALDNAATETSPITTVQHWRWGSGGHWRWGSRGGGGHWRYGSRGGHWRWGSRGRW
jgi:hypothetical protein